MSAPFEPYEDFDFGDLKLLSREKLQELHLLTVGEANHALSIRDYRGASFFSEVASEAKDLLRKLDIEARRTPPRGFLAITLSLLRFPLFLARLPVDIFTTPGFATLLARWMREAEKKRKRRELIDGGPVRLIKKWRKEGR